MNHPLPPDAPSLDLTPEAMRVATDACTRWAIDHIAGLAARPSWDLDGAREVAAAFIEPPPETGAPLETLLQRFAGAVTKSFNSAGPGYLAYIPGGGLYPAALADYLALAVNRYVGVWNAAPALVQMESTAIAWLRDLVGYAPSARGLLTSGGSMSNWIGVVTARRNRLGDDFSRAILYVSEDAHHAIHKAAVLAGFPERNLRTVAVDARRRMRVAALEEAIAHDRAAGLQPFLVAASAGTTNTGAVDPIAAIADVCAREQTWFHVDAAYGGFFRLARRDFFAGIDRADSLVLDPHKGLFLPYGTGCLLVRDPEALRRAHAFRAGYLQDLEHPDDADSFADISPELSRDFRGLRLWLPLALFGVAAFRANLEEKLALARWAYEELRATPGCMCLDEPQLSVVAFRFVPPHGDADTFNRRLLQRVHEYRRVYLSSTVMEGAFVLRFCILSFRTHGREVEMAVEDVRRAARELGA
jgi:aromatic-L-amino-acid decarboxylase